MENRWREYEKPNILPTFHEEHQQNSKNYRAINKLKTKTPTANMWVEYVLTKAHLHLNLHLDGKCAVTVGRYHYMQRQQ